MNFEQIVKATKHKSPEQRNREALSLARQVAFNQKYPESQVRMAKRISQLKADLDLGVSESLAFEGHFTEKQKETMQEILGN